MTDIKEDFKNWLISADNKKNKTTILTASEYINRLNRLSQRLYNNDDWQRLSYDLYILRLLFMKSSYWRDIEKTDLKEVVSYLYSYKQRNRNFNDRYNQYFHSVRKQLDVPLSLSRKKTDFFLDFLNDTKEYAMLSKWLQNTFITEKVHKYLSWLYVNKTEKSKLATALAKLSVYLIYSKKLNKTYLSNLDRQTIWMKREEKSNSSIQIVEANAILGRNFYSKYKDGKAEKLMSVQEVSRALGCAESSVRDLIDDGNLNLKPGTNKIIAENVRRFLRRRHTKRTVGFITQDDLIKDKNNWVKMKEAEVISHRSASYIRQKVKEGRVAYTRYGIKKFLYFVPDLRKI